VLSGRIVRRAVPYVDRILRGADPAELPVQVPVKFETVVNVKTARVHQKRALIFRRSHSYGSADVSRPVRA
jgi:hypothetical protein